MQPPVKYIIQILIISMVTTVIAGNVEAQVKDQVIRIAKLRIDSSKLSEYKAALTEEIETSIRVEAGVLTLYAVFEKEQPTHVTVFEIYANTAAYQSHIQTPHFKKYKATTQNMVKSLELSENVAIVLAKKPNK